MVFRQALFFVNLTIEACHDWPKFAGFPKQASVAAIGPSPDVTVGATQIWPSQ